jgi:exopolysaccharide biosynthesis polyprenyl glycosylphosphotransferase
MVIAKPEFENFHGIPLLAFSTTPERNLELLLKRIADLTFSIILLSILSPLFLFISVLIKLTSPGPVLFKQVRSGLAGRKFLLYKFRSMVPDAEEKLPEILHLNERNGPAFKLKNDPRVTRIGKILRVTNMDELPQLINVLKGDMSFVGPRPPIPSEVEKYERWQRRRLSMKPGITCFWQISKTREMDFSEWMKLDLYYIDNWSLITDLKIVLWTISKIFFGIGAKEVKFSPRDF